MHSTYIETMSMEEILHRFGPRLQSCRESIIAGMADAPQGDLLAKYFERGKMLRALLVFIAASLVGGKPDEVEMAGAAFELLHGAALVHDDIIDDATQRRGLSALHAQVGINTALVLGDYLMLRAFDTLGKAERCHPSERVLLALNTLSHYAQECCRGQVQELITLDHSDAEEDYLSIVRGKTASQFAAATTVGAILGNGTWSQIEALRTYGLNLGIAFQIRDDVLDLVGDADTLGKPVRKSLSQGRPMLPLIYLMKFGSPASCEKYHQIRSAGDGHLKLIALLEEENIFDRVRTTQESYLAIAGKALDEFPPSVDTEALRALANYIVARDV